MRVVPSERTPGSAVTSSAMTPGTAETKGGAAELAVDPSEPMPGEAVLRFTPVGVKEWLILATLGARGIPLTLRQLQKESGVALPDLQRIVSKLCAGGLVRRLNTIIESFSTARTAQPRVSQVIR